MHVKKWKTNNRKLELREINIARELMRQAHLRRMLHHVPYFKLRTAINEFTPR